MMQLEFGGRRFDIPAGELTVGTDASCGLVLTGEGVLARHAVLRATTEGSAIVSRTSEAAATQVNGVKVGAESVPVLHGDRIQIGGHELLVVDNRKSGSTQFLDASAIAAMSSAPSMQKAAGGPAPVTGGRLVCLTDGREYTVGASLVFGREAGNDVVVEHNQVSRRHAEITATPGGYVLSDLSTNGTFVNGQRIEGPRTLARADMIRVGDSEFRFYADQAPKSPPPPAESVAPEPPPLPAGIPPLSTPMSSGPVIPPINPERPPMVGGMPPATPMSSGGVIPPSGASHRLNDTLHGQSLRPFAPPAAATAPAPEPPAQPSGSAAAMASFLVRSGKLKGTRLPIRVPVVNIGRAEYNDVVIADDSVSTAHAKLQRREGIWVLTDLGSTNGSFVDGEAVSGEVALGPGVTVRFGQVSVLFEPTDDAMGVAKGSGTQMMEPLKAPPAPPPAPAEPPRRPTPPPPPPVSAAPPRASAPSSREPQPPRPAPAARRPPPVVTAPAKSGGKWLAPLLLILALGAVIYFLLTR
ncbi:MAG: FHA domain-containing protein [Gemmatimonadota bacterium]